MSKRVVLVVLLTLAAVLALAAPAVASPPTTYATSQGFTATLDAANAGTYQVSLYGNGYYFTTSDSSPYQTLYSQEPMTVYNSGTMPFSLFVSADGPPTWMGMYNLSFSDSPSQDQVRWSLSQSSTPGGDTSITDSWATTFGDLYPTNSMTLYSFLTTGSGFTYPAQYSWTGTVYAVPLY
jgi:hypothetical protein